MMLKQRVMDPRQKDDISEALAFTEQPDADNPSGKPFRVVPAYVYRWHPSGDDQKALKAATVGERSRDLIFMTRYYPTLTPPVVVDFEPAPPTPFWEEEKRRFCTAKGIIYIPIYLGDQMDESGFAERRRACERLMMAIRVEASEDAALGEVTEAILARPRLPKSVEEWLQDPELMRLIDQEALKKVEAQIAAGRRLTGNARLHVIRGTKGAIIAEIRKGMRSGGIVDPLERYRQPAAAAE